MVLGAAKAYNADTADLSASVLALACSVALHATYPGRRASAGNLVLPFSPGHGFPLTGIGLFFMVCETFFCETFSQHVRLNLLHYPP
jgi:hypothetical protein